jgi:hypothetical protein
MSSVKSPYALSIRRLAVPAALLVLLPCFGFAKTYPMTAASIVPSAAGELKTSTDKNGNTEIKIKIQHLANPQSLTPSKNLYIVWLQPSGGSPERAGTLKVNGKLNGSFETTSPHTNFDVTITAEDDPSVKAPTGPEVLRASARP